MDTNSTLSYRLEKCKFQVSCWNTRSKVAKLHSSKTRSALYGPTRERGTEMYCQTLPTAHALLPLRSFVRSFALIQIHSSVVSPQNFTREASSPSPSSLPPQLRSSPPCLRARNIGPSPRVGRLRTLVLIVDCIFGIIST